MIDDVPETTMFVAATPPMVTVASLAKPVPAMVTLLPPVVLPMAGEIDDTLSEPDEGPEGEFEPHAAASKDRAATIVAPQSEEGRDSSITIRTR
ncbi:MAG: hypothetical protein QM736_19265 [Vicinamibacterales bacterium]